ncbi:MULTISPECIES: hypothetical protein [Bacillus cereus group]|uniref:hypothetical protein n=1 Tax=Bacillus cereus group TaxID=86661 RepID=UPI0029C1555B|nr:hypothetical protein [Bacillus cereus group sp. BfR-BA-01363]MDX5853686.1 hypothetical protein [Bacillus cereus group sp. BfR-BA-01363]
MLLVELFQNTHNLRREVQKQFKERGFTLPEKYFVMNEALGYAPNIKELTNDEIHSVLKLLKEKY